MNTSQGIPVGDDVMGQTGAVFGMWVTRGHRMLARGYQDDMIFCRDSIYIYICNICNILDLHLSLAFASTVVSFFCSLANHFLSSHTGVISHIKIIAFGGKGANITLRRPFDEAANATCKIFERKIRVRARNICTLGGNIPWFHRCFLYHCITIILPVDITRSWQGIHPPDISHEMGSCFHNMFFNIPRIKWYYFS